MKYIGLTIGPIYKTLQDAKKTRELWAGSYLFSYIMKRIITKFQDRPFIIPYVNKDDPEFEEIITGKREVGLFHDRCIFQAQDSDFELLDTTITDILVKIARKIDAGSTDTVFEYLRQYFSIYYCEAEYHDEENQSTINKKMNAYLDSFELQQRFNPEEKKAFVTELLGETIKCKKNFLAADAFENKKRFESIPEIAVKELDLESIDRKKYDDLFTVYEKNEDEDNEAYDLYKELEKAFPGVPIRRYHKYAAIVHADGDNLGATIKNMEGKGGFDRFSKALFQFTLKAHNLIRNFGGVTIFAGGDDLLFFSPVVGRTGSTLLDLIGDIDEAFSNAFKAQEIKPTLSFGASISYHKFPLYEALEVSRMLLFEKAKQQKNKNAVAFRVLKHSGQYFEAVIEKGSAEYRSLADLLKNRDGAMEENTILFTSMIYNLFALSSVLNVVGNDAYKLNNFFANHFNETVHHAQNHEPLITGIQRFIHAVYSSGNYQTGKERRQTVFGGLRLNHFIRAKEIQKSKRTQR